MTEHPIDIQELLDLSRREAAHAAALRREIDALRRWTDLRGEWARRVARKTDLQVGWSEALAKGRESEAASFRAVADEQSPGVGAAYREAELAREDYRASVAETKALEG